MRAALAHYQVGALKHFAPISEGVQNSNYLVETESGRFVFTLYEDLRADALEFIFAWMAHLEQQGLKCAPPVVSKSGKASISVAGKPAALLPFKAGKWPRRPSALQCREIGTCLAQMHTAAAGFKGKRVLQEDILAHYEASRGAVADYNAALAQELEAYARTIAQQLNPQLPSGVIHSDLFPDNVLFEGEQISCILDFYMAHNDTFLYDLANTLNAWCFEHETEFNLTRSQQLLYGYQSVRKLSPEEIQCLPAYAGLAALRWFMYRMHKWQKKNSGDIVTPKDPMQQVQQLRFHMQARSAAEYGI